MLKKSRPDSDNCQQHSILPKRLSQGKFPAQPYQKSQAAISASYLNKPQTFGNNSCENQSIFSNRNSLAHPDTIPNSSSHILFESEMEVRQPSMLLDSVNSLKRSGVHNLRESMSSQAGFRVNSSLLKASRSLGNEEFLLCDSSEGLLCQNNDLKKAKYRIKDSDCCLCSRCAIALLQQGYVIEEIHRSQPKRDSLLRLAERIGFIEEKIEANLAEASGKKVKESVRIFFEEEVQLYDSIISAVQEMRAASVIRYEGIFHKVQEELMAEELDLREKLYEVETIKNELSLYRMSMPEKTMESCMREWSDRLDSIERYNRLELQLKQQPLDLKLNTITHNIKEHLSMKLKNSSSSALRLNSDHQSGSMCVSNLSSVNKQSSSNSLTGSMCAREKGRNAFSRRLLESPQHGR